MTPPTKRNPKRYEHFRQSEAAAGRPLSLSGESTQRRLRALACYGWTMSDIAPEVGIDDSEMRRLLAGRKKVYRRTRDKIRRWYEAHELVMPPDDKRSQRARIRNHAAKMGWHPPLDWEDIENGVLAEVERDKGKPLDGRFDLHEVDSAWLTADFSRPLSPLERAEILRRWRLEGRSDNDLEALTGWRPSRYSPLIPSLHQEAS